MAKHASLDASVEIETPEQVAFSYTLAGASARALAAFVDYLLCVVSFVFLLFMFQLLFGGVGRVLGGGSAAWLTAFIVLAQFVILWGYYVLFEGLNDGRTPGKRWLGLRVVQDGGFSVSF